MNPQSSLISQFTSFQTQVCNSPNPNQLPSAKMITFPSIFTAATSAWDRSVEDDNFGYISVQDVPVIKSTTTRSLWGDESNWICWSDNSIVNTLYNNGGWGYSRRWISNTNNMRNGNMSITINPEVKGERYIFNLSLSLKESPICVM